MPTATQPSRTRRPVHPLGVGADIDALGADIDVFGADIGVEIATPMPRASGREPFEEVYRTYANAVFAFCWSQTGSHSDAEDLAADVFASAFVAYTAADPKPGKVRAWLLRIARNAVIDHYRRNGRRSAILARFFSGSTECADTDVETEVMRRDEVIHVIRVLGRLRERDRVLIGLRIASNLSYAEVASVLGVSEHAAHMATHRALEKLRVLCEDGVT
jgi:RNA polymerase sigma-70 factor (ECF subfamily)